jgi:hypothetical protein
MAEKGSPTIWTTSVIYKTLTQSVQSPNGRKLDQSGHPGKKNTGGSLRFALINVKLVPPNSSQFHFASLNIGQNHKNAASLNHTSVETT